MLYLHHNCYNLIVPPRPPAAWLLLIHQLPPQPLYLRAKVRRRLERVGAVAVKNSVYVLPDAADCLEDFQWIAQEAVAGGGDASIVRAELIEGLSADALVARFRSEITTRYKPIATALGSLLAQARRAGRRSDAAVAARLLQLRRQAEDIRRTDFFESEAGRNVETLMTSIDRARARPAGSRSPARTAASREDLIGRVWVTRADPHVDRLATAWLVRRFIDSVAAFRFVDRSGGKARAGEVSFDMVGATFGHEGDRCTFETLTARLRLDDPALRAIGEIVHDVDLKDARFGRPEAHGLAQLVQGLAGSHPDSAARIEAALPLFDALYASFGGRTTSGSAGPRRRAHTRAKKR